MDEDVGVGVGEAGEESEVREVYVVGFEWADG